MAHPDKLPGQTPLGSCQSQSADQASPTGRSSAPLRTGRQSTQASGKHYQTLPRRRAAGGNLTGNLLPRESLSLTEAGADRSQILTESAQTFSWV